MYQMVRTVDQLEECLDIIGDGIAALDFETTSFTPDTGKVRLAQLYNEDGWWVIDFFDIAKELEVEDGFKATAHWFDEACWIVFHAGFEMKWFAYNTDAAITCWDVAFLRKAVDGGGHFSLARALKIDLEYDMPKEQQASDWSAPVLSKEQLDYAADDAIWTWKLWEHWRAKADDGQMRGFNLFNDMQPAVLEMQDNGMRLDPERHQILVDQWTALEEDRVNFIREYVSEDDVANLNSGAQWSDFFNAILPDAYINAWPRTDKTGYLSMANDNLLMVAAMFEDNIIGDVIRAKRDLTTIRKYKSSFGDNLIFMASRQNGRLHANYNIAAARTGRFSCSAPNLQQIPRDRDFFGERLSVRKSFIADDGYVLAALDYSGIELRVLALMAGDEQLLEDCVWGDVHLEVGSFWAGRRLDKKVTEDKDMRSKAKGVSFGIIYGSSELGLAGTMGVSIAKAEELMQFWGDRYPKAMAYRNTAKSEAEANGNYLRCVDGGTIYMGKQVMSTKAANYPVQRGALSVMARAIYRHKETLDHLTWRSEVKMLSTIHDAMMDEVKDGPHAQEVLQLMAEDMRQGYLDMFPDAPLDRLLEGGVGPNWGDIDEVAF